MSFTQRWAEFVQRNPSMAADDDAKVTLPVAAMKKVCKAFFESGRNERPEDKTGLDSLLDILGGRSCK